MALLGKLVNHTIVRTEPRLGGYFVETTHEFLIGPILEAISNALSRDPDYRRYRQALRTLEGLQRDDVAGPNRQLPRQNSTCCINTARLSTGTPGAPR